MSPLGRLRLWKIDVEVRGFRTLLRSRSLMALARRFPRVARLPPGRLVVRHEDAVHALRHGRSFGMPYLAKMEALRGPFMLGFDDGPEHARLRAAVKKAIDGCDLDALHRESRSRAEKILSDRDRIEVVTGLIDPVLASTVGRYLGVGELTRDQLVDARTVFHDIFINGLEDPRVSLRAQDAAARLHAHVGSAVDDRLAGSSDEPDILGRLIAGGWRDRDELTNHVKGLLVAWTASVSRAMAFAMDALFKQPDGLELARKAACDEDCKAMGEVLREAFRFIPPAPAVERVCRRETPVHGRAVRREGGVIVAVSSAMMDERVIDDPGRFRVGRPCKHDLTFGLGSHACLGRDLAREQLTGVMIALLRKENLRWAYGIKLEGPFPHKLVVTL